MDASMSLADARAWLRARVEEGERCPCCTQFAKVYKRQITSTSAAAAIAMYRAARLDPVHLPPLLKERGIPRADEAKLVHWGLIAADADRSAWWRVTPLGGQWILGRISVPRYARIYDGRCLGLVGDPWTVQQALGTRFDYAELMRR
jgi:hypothetical protein